MAPAHSPWVCVELKERPSKPQAKIFFLVFVAEYEIATGNLRIVFSLGKMPLASHSC
jgi:hypothetical protein